jgi:hypothetical protein
MYELVQKDKAIREEILTLKKAVENRITRLSENKNRFEELLEAYQKFLSSFKQY